MKKIFVVITILVVMVSCATTKEAKLSRAELRNAKKIARQDEVRNAVESRKYIIKFDKLYFSYGGMADLLPRANYIIVDGEKAIINTAYLGRQFDIRRIAAIDIFGRSVNYQLTNDLSKGNYKVNMKVSNGGGNSFDLYVDISKNGYCTVSVSSLKISYIRYSGYIVPISPKTDTILQEGSPI
jgi:hypothetical protein